MSAIHRVLDANFNRASEGMRVLEDISRFVLENHLLCTSIKQCRHDLRSTQGSVFSRDTNGDIGTSISTAQEGSRESLIEIATAAGNRCAEALRVIEEFFKLGDKHNKTEAIRYTMYELSADVIRGLGATQKQQWNLCFVMTSSECVLPWRDTLEQSLRAGCDCVQVREKTMSTAKFIAHTAEVIDIASKYNVPVIVNDRVDIMLATDASGVHLGASDMSIRDARTLCGSNFIIGATAHSHEEVNCAIEAGADYLGIGAMFASPTKPTAPVAGPELLKSVQGQNHLAIGGITPGNIQQLLKVGCKGIAVSSAIAQSAAPGTITEELFQQMQHKAQPA